MPPLRLFTATRKRLRQKAITRGLEARRRSPTAQIERILARKANLYERTKDPKYSHELALLKAPRKKPRYSVIEADQTSALSQRGKKEDRSHIHTHPLVLRGEKLQQIFAPSVADLFLLLTEENYRVGEIGVPSLRNQRKIAGYCVLRKTKTVNQIQQIIKLRSDQYLNLDSKRPIPHQIDLERLLHETTLTGNKLGGFLDLWLYFDQHLC